MSDGDTDIAHRLGSFREGQRRTIICRDIVFKNRS